MDYKPPEQGLKDKIFLLLWESFNIYYFLTRLVRTNVKALLVTLINRLLHAGEGHR
jgi:hypothetical protein